MGAQHPTTLKSRYVEAMPPASGVVDGVIDVESNQDGSVSLHIRVNMPGRVGSDRIEVILPPGHKETLAEAIAARRPAVPASPPPAIPCAVGVRPPHP